MEVPSRYTLVKLSDTELTVMDPSDDVRGRKVIDVDGRDIGLVDELLIDDTEKRVRFLRVTGGGFLGIGGQRFLIPVDAVVGTEKDVVRVDRTREHVAGAPTYDPDLADHRDYAEQLYAYYGTMPFWGVGYIYPMYPFYL
jgi:sporulation protein YlmC with PRC-barrel domain